MRNHRIKVLFTTSILHYPAIGGPYLRIENSIKVLSKISDLHIYSRVSLSDLGGVAGLSFYNQYCKSFYFAPYAALRNKYVSFSKRAINFLSRKFICSNLFTNQESKSDFQHLLKTADKIKTDVIWLGYGNISYPLLKYIKENSTYKVILDTDSVWSRFVLRGIPYAKNGRKRKQIEAEGKAKEEEERWGTQLADVTTAVS